MNAISHTQPLFTKEDDEREQAALTIEEKEAIEDDIKGRLLEDVVMVDDDNNDDEDVGEQQHHNVGEQQHHDDVINAAQHEQQQQQQQEEEEVNNDIDIDPQLLLEFMASIDGIPFEDKSDYMRALVINEGLFETECNPILFLRRENYDAELAAKRMVKYWKMRVRIFGDERAFLPMTLYGALQDDVDAWRSMPNWFCLLPTDIKGRTVMYRDVNIFYGAPSHNLPSSFARVRMAWYVSHVALQRYHTQMHGVILVCTSRGVAGSVERFKRKEAKVGIVSAVECLPIKCCAIHSCPSRTVLKMLMPAVRLFMSTFYRIRHVIHSPELSATELCRDLREYGLLQNRLPPKLGGKYDIQNWLNHRMEIEGI